MVTPLTIVPSINIASNYNILRESLLFPASFLHPCCPKSFSILAQSCINMFPNHLFPHCIQALSNLIVPQYWIPTMIPIVHHNAFLCSPTILNNLNPFLSKADWFRYCIHLTSLNLKRFKIVQAIVLKMIASRSPSVASPTYQIS
jgi:hypothetical protein